MKQIVKTKIKIAIADDHLLMIDGIKTALAKNPWNWNRRWSK